MGRVFTSMILGTVVMAAMLMFNGLGANTTSLFDLMLNPTDWGNNGFWGIFASLFATAGAGIIVIGLAAIIKQDWVFRLGIITSLSSVIIAPYVYFFTFINSQMSYLGQNCLVSPACSSLNQVGGIGQWIGLLIISPLFLYAMWSCIEYVFKGDSM